uniref:Si:dkey-26c10.5 n=1 Tax=Oryzias latipes TaxID=8090 RepID=A0A3P9JAI5_ORYLA
MEMQEAPAKAETEDKEKRAEKPKQEAKTEDEANQEQYSTLLSPSEEIYSEAFHAAKPPQELPGNARLYRAVCACLLVICLILLAVVVILGMKLQVCSGEAVCNEGLCMEYIQNTRAACEKCPRGWIAYRNYCYFLSTLRLGWDDSQSNCTKVGGSLAVIESQELQNFLSKNGKLNYWIGLKQDQSEWKWNNNKMLGKSYWKSNPGNGDCALLFSRDPVEKNWAKISCQAASYYICQIEY